MSRGPASPPSRPASAGGPGGPSPDGGAPLRPGDPPQALVHALQRVLRPLIRLMLSRGITYPYLSELLKGLFVEVAERDFRLDTHPPTDSRVSLVSGVHRKDVSRLRQLLKATEPVSPQVVTLGAHLVARWTGDPLYLSEDGQPMPLARLARHGGEQSFEALVASVNSDIRSRVVLDEWLHLGVVHLDPDGRVKLNTDAFVPARGAEEKAHFLGLNLADHASASVHNLLNAAPPLMERSVHYTGLSPAAVERLALLSERQGMKALLAVNGAALEAEARDTAAEPGQHPARQRMTFGVYFYAEPMPDGDAPPAPTAETQEDGS